MQTKTGRAKEVFAAGNTGVGFHSFFEHIAGPDMEHVFVLKGGPGTGKSTFMKQIAVATRAQGLSVELHHCSSDSDSLDGLVIPALKAAFIDGMRPHIYDPPYPGAVGHILNLGQCWHSSGIRPHKQAIMAAGVEGQRLFHSAYRYLKAAREIYENGADKIRRAQDWGWVNQQGAQLVDRLFGQQRAVGRPGRERHLFAGAFTPQGPKDYLASLTGPATRIILIRGLPGSGPSVLLQRIACAAVECGQPVELYHNPIDPDKLQHVLLPEADVFMGTCSELFPYSPATPFAVVNLDYGLDQGEMNRNRTETELDRQTFLQLIKTAVQMIKRAGAAHGEVEAHYVDNMDFDAVDRLREQVLQGLLGKEVF